MKRLLLMMTVGVLSISALVAQMTVSGKVTTADGGSPLEGVEVMVKDMQAGALTDSDGSYKVEVPSGGTTLVFTYTGRKTKEEEINGRSTIDVTMEEEFLQTNEVIVTALGLKEKRDESASSSSNVSTQVIGRSGESGVIQGLAGKTSGLYIQKSSGDPGAGAYIQIRGQSTITGNIQPLVVVDGMPINNNSVSTEADVQGVVEQSRLNDINPDDIESIEVLKGAAAAAQWGTRAANGVLIITTKKGKAGVGGKKFNVNFRSTMSFDQISMMHPLQTTFGQGTGGTWVPNNSLSWGDKIANRSGEPDKSVTAPGQYFYMNPDGSLSDTYSGYFEAEGGNKYYAQLRGNKNIYDKDGNKLFTTPANGQHTSKNLYDKSNYDQVFRTGFFWDKSIGISAGNEKSSYFLSFSDLDQKGVIQNNSDYRRSTLRFNVEHRFTDKLKFSSTATYARSTSNRIQQGSNTAGLFLGYLRTPVDYDNTDYVGTTYSKTGVPTFNAHKAYRSYLGGTNPSYNNPGWTINRQQNNTTVNRYILGTELTYDPFAWLSFTARGGADYYGDNRTTFFPVYSAANTTGNYIDYHIDELQLNSDVFGRAAFHLGSKVKGTALVGFNFNNRKYNDVYAQINTFTVADAPANLENSASANRTVYDFTSEIATAANYVTLGFDIGKNLFVDFTGRTETSSTFGPNVSKYFFYPSTSAAYVFRPHNDKSAFSFGKLRASYGQVGVQPGPYLTTNDFVQAGPVLTSGWGDGIDPNAFGTGSYLLGSTQGNPNLKPERKSEFEVGTDLRFLKDRLSVGFTYYRNITKGAIFAVDVPASTGFAKKWDNAATISNRGIEADFKLDVIAKKDFNWNIFGNLTRNRNMVDDLQGVQSIFLNGFEGTSSRAVEGKPLGALWGASFQKNEDGSYIVDANGFPKATPTEGYLGDPNPKWRGGLGSELRWKGLGVSCLFETSQGGQMWNGTLGVLNYFGRSATTATETTLSAADAANVMVAWGGSVADNYDANADGSYTFRGTVTEFAPGKKVALDQAWYTGIGGGFGPVSSQFIYDASWTRLRELTLSYRINSEKLSAAKLGNAELSLSGRNLFIWTKWQGIDPETNLTGTSNGRGLEYFNNPGTRSYLVTLKLNF